MNSMTSGDRQCRETAQIPEVAWPALARTGGRCPTLASSTVCAGVGQPLRQQRMLQRLGVRPAAAELHPQTSA